MNATTIDKPYNAVVFRTAKGDFRVMLTEDRGLFIVAENQLSIKPRSDYGIELTLLVPAAAPPVRPE